MKIHTPLKLTDYQIINSKKNTSLEEVDTELRDMLSWMRQEEQLYNSSKEYDDLINKIISGELKPKGSLSSWAREYIAIKNAYPSNNYNMSEMFRQQVMEKSAGYVQKYALDMLFDSYKEKPEDIKEVRKDFVRLYSHLKAPNTFVVTNEFVRYYEKGVKQTTKPGAAKTLKTYACDTHYCKAFLQDNFILFRISLKCGGNTELLFEVPDIERFKGNKATRPTIRLNSKNQVEFVFTIEKEVAEVEHKNSYLGVDLGKIEPFVATAINICDKTHSAPIVVNKKVRKLQEKIENKYKLVAHLKEKAVNCDISGEPEKRDILLEERRRILRKITRLKKEQTAAIANQVVEEALARKATIVVENLRWLGSKGGKWNHSATQKAIAERAAREGMKTKKVSATSTSQKCSDCGGKLTKYKNRRLKCVKCTSVIDRDVSASREIARRAGRAKYLATFKQENSASTRMSYPAVVDTKVNNSGLPVKEVTLLKGENSYDYNVGKYSNCRDSKS